MKFGFTKIYREVLKNGGIAAAIAAAKEGCVETGTMDVYVGSKFVAEDQQTEVQLSNFEGVKRDDKSWEAQAMRDLASFFGGYCRMPDPDDGIYGDWTEEFEKDKHIYYVFSPAKNVATDSYGDPMKIIICRSGMISMTNDMVGLQYYADVMGKITSVTPEPGDIIFDSLDELHDFEDWYDENVRNRQTESVCPAETKKNVLNS